MYDAIKYSRKGYAALFRLFCIGIWRKSNVNIVVSNYSCKFVTLMCNDEITSKTRNYSEYNAFGHKWYYVTLRKFYYNKNVCTIKKIFAVSTVNK